MTDPVEAFVESLRIKDGKAKVRVQSFSHDAGRAAGLALGDGWWVRLAEEGNEENPTALIVGPFETVEESRVAVGSLMEALGLVSVTMNGQPIKETNA